jgi:ATP-binding protein involved in chromosome partitioning
MKQVIAIPTAQDCLCQHFGHCEKFTVFETDDGKVINETFLTPPSHAPGIFPAWLSSHGITHVIASGMGQRAIALFNQYNIQILLGAAQKPAKTVVDEYLNGELETGINACDH